MPIMAIARNMESAARGEDRRARPIDELVSAPRVRVAHIDIVPPQLFLSGRIASGQRAAGVAVEDRLHVPEFFGGQAVPLTPPFLPDIVESGGSEHISDVIQMSMGGMVATELQPTSAQEIAQALRR